MAKKNEKELVVNEDVNALIPTSLEVEEESGEELFEEMDETTYAPVDLSTREGVHQYIGSIKTDSFDSAQKEYFIAKKLYLLTRNDSKTGQKRYKAAGFKNQKDLFKACGIGIRNAQYYISNFAALGQKAYKKLLNLGLNENQIRMLKQAGACADDEVMKIGSEEVDLNTVTKEFIEKKFEDLKKDNEGARKALLKAQEKLLKAQRDVNELRRKIDPVPEDVQVFTKEIKHFASTIDAELRTFRRFKKTVETTDNTELKQVYQQFVEELVSNIGIFTSEL